MKEPVENGAFSADRHKLIDRLLSKTGIDAQLIDAIGREADSDRGGPSVGDASLQSGGLGSGAAARSISARTSAVAARPRIVALSRATGSVLRLFCLPYAGGGPRVFHEWPALLPK